MSQTLTYLQQINSKLDTLLQLVGKKQIDARTIERLFLSSPLPEQKDLEGFAQDQTSTILSFLRRKRGKQ